MKNISSFTLQSNKKVIFEEGSIISLSDEVKCFGNNAVVFIGGKSLKKSGILGNIEKDFKNNKISYKIFNITTEPDVQTIDNIISQLVGESFDCVISIGGGSVIDSGKAVSAMLTEEGSIEDYLEGVGTLKPKGTKIPFIAVSTTAGTGSEATFNAVIKSSGKSKFKKSLRHSNFVPDCVIIDPQLYYDCPTSIAAASGLDALSQLLESYISTKSFLYTDILAEAAISKILSALPVVATNRTECSYSEKYKAAWSNMAFASYISGITLSNAGLALVHGIAGPIGGLYDAPHGAICGTLLGECMKATILNLEKNQPDSEYLLKFTTLGNIAFKSDYDLPKESRSRFYKMLDTIIQLLKIPTLSEMGIKKEDLPKISEISSNKNNPVIFEKSEIEKILLKRL